MVLDRLRDAHRPPPRNAFVNRCRRLSRRLGRPLRLLGLLLRRPAAALRPRARRALRRRRRTPRARACEARAVGVMRTASPRGRFWQGGGTKVTPQSCSTHTHTHPLPKRYPREFSSELQKMSKNCPGKLGSDGGLFLEGAELTPGSVCRCVHLYMYILPIPVLRTSRPSFARRGVGAL